MGSCCSNPNGENGEDFIRKIFTPFKFKNNFDYKNILEDLKHLLKEDCIFTGDFITYMQRFWSDDKETKELQKFLFVKYFSMYKAKIICVYEILLIILPFLNMSTKEKLSAFKSLIEYLQKNKTIVFPRTIREIIYHYYFFHTVLMTKIYINYLDVKIKQSINSTVFNTSKISNENYNSENQVKERLEKDKISKADYDKPKHTKTNYEMSEEYSKNIEQLRSEKGYSNNPKAFAFTLVNFSDIRDHFFDKYCDMISKKDS
jgi:hypothetical protein